MILPLPKWAPVTGLALVPFLLFVKHTENARLYHARVAHEMTHARQMRNDGWLRFAVRYLFSSEARVRYEAEAYVCGDLPHLLDEKPLLGRSGVVQTLAERIGSRIYFPRWWRISRHPGEAAIKAALEAEIAEYYVYDDHGSLAPRQRHG
jgi:hypothetical protein